MKQRFALVVLLAASLSGAPLHAAGAEENPEIKAMGRIDKGDYAGAAPLLEAALQNAQARYGPDDPSLAIEMGNLAEVYRHLGRLTEAEDLLLRAVTLDERAGNDNAQGLATTLNNLALVYRDQNRLPEAEKVALRSLSLLESALGPSHPDVARALANLAAIYAAEGHPERAVPLLTRAVQIADKTDKGRGGAAARYKRLLAEIDPTAEAAAPTPFAGGITPQPMPKPLAESVYAAVMAEGADETAAPTAAPVPQERPETPPNEPPPVTMAEAPAPQAAAAEPALVSPDPARAAVSEPAPVPHKPVVVEVTITEDGEAGDYALQLATVREAGAVEGEWRRLTLLFPDIGKLSLRPTKPIEVPTRGTFWRVAAGSFDSREAADTACQQLVSAGAWCQVTRP